MSDVETNTFDYSDRSEEDSTMPNHNDSTRNHQGGNAASAAAQTTASTAANLTHAQMPAHRDSGLSLPPTKASPLLNHKSITHMLKTKGW